MENFKKTVIGLTREIKQEIFNLDDFKPERKKMICALIDLEDMVRNLKKK